MLAPYKDETWEIWACSPSNYQLLPRVTRWFELHKAEQLLSWDGMSQDHYVDWIAYHSHEEHKKFDLYMIDQEYVPHAKTFPADQLIEEFSAYFFTSSFSWMIAWAIQLKAMEIGIYGIDMTTLEEYRNQRPHFQHFIWLARERGIKVTVPIESDILQPPPLYGYAYTMPMARKLAVRERELRKRIAEAEAERKKLDLVIERLTGSLDDNDYVQTTWTGTL